MPLEPVDELLRLGELSLSEATARQGTHTEKEKVTVSTYTYYVRVYHSRLQPLSIVNTNTDHSQ